MGSIVVSNLSKAYKQYSSKWARLAQWLVPNCKPLYTSKWVLQDINFSVNPGESVGIVGMNGAGKSTLLKLITGTSIPTLGTVKMTGRVTARLELGMGFHPDFSGRQNIFSAGQLLGISKGELEILMPNILSFAEIGEYIDQPVRVYSSGMQMRLAFSLATAIRPDILIVDEALSVGDAYFQHKSFDRIRQFRKEGTTLLIVSHDKSAIQSICDRAILLNKGKIEMQGPPEMVMDYYNAILADHQNQEVQQKLTSDGKIQTISGTGEASVKNIALLDDGGKVVEVVDVGQKVVLRIEVQSHEPIERLVLGYSIKDRLGQVIFGTNTDLTNQPVYAVRSGESICFDIHFHTNLGPGTYSIQTALVSTETHLVNNYEWCDLATIFTVVNYSHSHFAGTAWIPPRIEIIQS
jgi:lipopolysaccharide transport system ATP-binding protein